MTKREIRSLVEDRDYWKKLCSKLSDKNVEMEMQLHDIKTLVNSGRVAHAVKFELQMIFRNEER